MNFEEYFNSHAGKRIAVCGIGVSNLPLIRILRSRGIAVEARDRKTEEQLGNDAEELKTLGVELYCGPDYLDGISNADIIYRSPSMRPDVPKLAEAINNSAVLTSEMEAFFEVCPCRIIGITGSDGKTTTSSVIAKMLEKAGYTTWLGGNIGTPLLDKVPDMKPEDFAVVELSSFQLMTMKKSPDIAVVTNIEPNHLDIHKDMAEYIDAKRNIFRYQNETGKAVFNLNNDVTKGFSKEAKGTVWVFSKNPLDKTIGNANAVYLSEKDTIIAVSDGKAEEIMKREDIKLPGLYNVENYMTAIAAVYGLADRESITEVARTFGGVEHRNEFVREFEGVRYYNNSIASSPTRTIAALKAFTQKVVLIAGGSDKHIPFEPLAEAVPDHVKALILLGATKAKIRESIENIADRGENIDMPPVYDANSLEEAVSKARSISRPGDIVCLAPACASFDMFKNFEERGNLFKKFVNELK